MKKTVAGKTYDTKKSIRLEYIDNIDDHTGILSKLDYRFSSTSLYKTKKGEYFFVFNGIDFKPISTSEAYNFCCNLEWTQSQLNKEFGNVIEWKLTATFEQWKRIKEYAAFIKTKY